MFSFSATQRTRDSDWWMFKQSMTKCHLTIFGLPWIICYRWATKSASVLVWPMLSCNILPLLTSKLAIKVWVPCRIYSNSLLRGCPGFIGLSPDWRCLACIPVISSILTTLSRLDLISIACRYSWQIRLTFSSNFSSGGDWASIPNSVVLNSTSR